MDFSLLSPLEFFVVPKNGDGRNNKTTRYAGARRLFIQNHLSVYNRVVQAVLQKGNLWRRKENSLAHMKWMCKYHIVFTPKYRRKIIYNQYKADIRDIIKQLCSYKGVEIIEVI